MTYALGEPVGERHARHGRPPEPPGPLFAYGTLRFPEILAALLGRVPDREPGAAPGWRVAAVPGRTYPVLVPGECVAEGVVITGLTSDDWAVIDAYEDDFYDLRTLTLADGRAGWAYLTHDRRVGSPTDWSPEEFSERHLTAFAARCAGWRRLRDRGAGA